MVTKMYDVYRESLLSDEEMMEVRRKYIKQKDDKRDVENKRNEQKREAKRLACERFLTDKED